MKRILSIIISIVALASLTLSCVKDEMYVGDPVIADIVFTPGVGQVTPDDQVTVSATITVLDGIASAEVQYKVNGGNAQSVSMTSSGDTYTGIIPAQADQSEVTFTIKASSKAGKTAMSQEKGYTVSSVPIEYGDISEIRMNEVNTADKYIEIVNPTDKPIIISGLKFAKNSMDEYYETAEGAPLVVADGMILEAGGFAVMGCKGADWSADCSTYLGTSSTGVSGSKSLLVVLQDSNGEPVDYFVNTAVENPSVGDAWDGPYEHTFNVAARIPDGSGDWYTATEGTICKTNGTDNSGDKFTHKMDFNRKSPAIISDVTYNPSSPKEEDEVTVSATIKNAKSATSATLIYSVGGGSSQNVTMTQGEANLYTAVIPAQAAESVVTFHIDAVGENDATVSSPEQTYTVASKDDPDPSYDYTKLVLNELNGNVKYVEICNTADEEIDLKGCYLVKDNADAKFFNITTTHMIPAKGYIVLLCKGYSGQGTDPVGDLTSTEGLSAKKPLKVELFDPEGNLLNTFERTGTYEDKANSFSRVPDATGDWYYAEPTEGAMNGVSNGIIDHGYTLVLNEIDPNDKKIELFNNTEAEMSLAGVTLFKDEGAEPVWTGAEGMTIAAGGFLVLYGKDHTDVDPSLVFNSGMSGKKSVCLQLKNAEGAMIDTFIRGQKDAAWGDVGLPEDKEHSFSRIGDGTGPRAYASPTIGAANGEKTSDIAVVK